MDGFLNQIPQLVEDGLGIDVAQILIQWVATAILFLVIFKFLWKPLTQLLEDRSNIISSDIEEAKKANEDASKIKDEMILKLEEAKTEAKNIIEASRDRGEKERVQIIQNAELDAKVKLTKAEEDIEREVQKARETLKKEIVDVAFNVAEKVLQDEVARGSHTKSVEEYLNDAK